MGSRSYYGLSYSDSNSNSQSCVARIKASLLWASVSPFAKWEIRAYRNDDERRCLVERVEHASSCGRGLGCYHYPQNLWATACPQENPSPAVHRLVTFSWAHTFLQCHCCVSNLSPHPGLVASLPQPHFYFPLFNLPVARALPQALTSPTLQVHPPGRRAVGCSLRHHTDSCLSTFPPAAPSARTSPPRSSTRLAPVFHSSLC